MVSSRASRLAAAFAVMALVLVLPRPAAAQGWLADRDVTEGPGIRLGDFELHPGLGVELGWDSNVYYTSDNPAPGLAAPLDSAILRVTPHLLFSTLGAQRREEGEARGGPPPVVQFRGGISGSYYEYFNDETRRNFGLDVGLTLTVLEGQPFSFRISDTFGRTVRPFTENTSGTSVARDRNDAAVDFTFSTPGQVLQIGALKFRLIGEDLSVEDEMKRVQKWSAKEGKAREKGVRLIEGGQATGAEAAQVIQQHWNITRKRFVESGADS